MCVGPGRATRKEERADAQAKLKTSATAAPARQQSEMVVSVQWEQLRVMHQAAAMYISFHGGKNTGVNTVKIRRQTIAEKVYLRLQSR
jgi:hypothetical protein